MSQRTVIVAVLAMIAWGGVCAAEPAQPTTVKVKGIVVDLPAGTQIRINMRARYLVLDPSGAATKDASPAEVFRADSTGSLKWEFSADNEGTTTAAAADFRFDKPLLTAPAGLVAILEFHTAYAVVCPPSAPNCGARTRNAVFGLPIRRDSPGVMPVCLQLRGGPNGVFVGINSDCTDPRVSGKRSAQPLK